MRISTFLAALLVALIMASCGSSEAKEASTATSTTANAGESLAKVDALKLYNLNCKLCHGNDGKLGLSGAKDLAASILTRDERIAIIRNGKGGMAAYKEVLTKKEIEALADYLDKFRQTDQ